MLFRPLNPPILDPPILGDFENPVPPKIGGLGGRNAAFEVDREMCVHRLLWGASGLPLPCKGRGLGG